MKIFALILFVAILTFRANCQDDTIIISGNFQNIPLKQFFVEIEKDCPVKFYYEKNQIDTVLVNIQLEKETLITSLSKILKNSYLNFYITKNNQVILYRGVSLRTSFMMHFRDDLKKESDTIDKKGKSRQALRQQEYRIHNIGVPGISQLQKATISGYLKNFDTGESIIGSNIYVEGAQTGTSSGNDGFYRLTLPPGNYKLIYSCIGMHPTKRLVNLYSNGNLHVEMENDTLALQEITVFADNLSNIEKIHVGMEKLEMKTIQSLPTLLGEPDIIKSVLLLPGVQTVGEGTAGFNVRGGKTDQNLILMDNTPIFYPSHFFGNFSSINPDAVEEATLFKGSIPAKYGGRISSIYEIKTKSGNLKKIKGNGGISPISLKLLMDGPIIKDKASFLLSTRGTYSDWVIDLIKKSSFLYNTKAGFFDIQGNFDYKINKENNIKLNYYVSQDRFKLRNDTLYKYLNALASLSLDHSFHENFSVNTSFNYSSFGYRISSDGNPQTAHILIHDVSLYNLRTDFTYRSHSLNPIDFGADITFYEVNPGKRLPVGGKSVIVPKIIDTERAYEYALYASDKFNLTPELTIEAGIRLSGQLVMGPGKIYLYTPDAPFKTSLIKDTVLYRKNEIIRTYLNPEYRLSVNYRINRESSVKLSCAKTNQYIHILSNTTAISPTDTWKLSDYYLTPQTGTQISIGYFRNFLNSKIETSFETYYKWIKNIKEYKPGADLLLNNHVETEIINGVGKAYGVELSVKKKTGRLNGWLSYTFSRTLLKSDTPFAEEAVNDGEYFPASYDKPHNLALWANLKISRRFRLACNTVYSTGRPITYPVGKYLLNNQTILHYSRYNQYRIPDYFRLDLSLTIEGNLKRKKLVHGTFTFSIYNITGRKNTYSIYFRGQENRVEGYKLSIFGVAIPTVTYNFKF